MPITRRMMSQRLASSLIKNFWLYSSLNLKQFRRKNKVANTKQNIHSADQIIIQWRSTRISDFLHHYNNQPAIFKASSKINQHRKKKNQNHKRGQGGIKKFEAIKNVQSEKVKEQVEDQERENKRRKKKMTSNFIHSFFSMTWKQQELCIPDASEIHLFLIKAWHHKIE